MAKLVMKTQTIDFTRGFAIIQPKNGKGIKEPNLLMIGKGQKAVANAKKIYNATNVIFAEQEDIQVKFEIPMYIFLQYAKVCADSYDKMTQEQWEELQAKFVDLYKQGNAEDTTTTEDTTTEDTTEE